MSRLRDAAQRQPLREEHNMNFRSFHVAVCFIALRTEACTTETADAPPMDEQIEQAKSILSAQGFDTTTLKALDEHNVVVEGDMVVNLETLLHASSEVVEKGFYHHFLYGQKAPASSV